MLGQGGLVDGQRTEDRGQSTSIHATHPEWEMFCQSIQELQQQWDRRVSMSYVNHLDGARRETDALYNTRHIHACWSLGEVLCAIHTACALYLINYVQ